MRAYDPRIEIRLIKAIKRKKIVDGLGVVVERYGELSALRLDMILGDHGAVRVSKSVREPAGAFSITLSDRPHDKFLETVYALIEPMDMVEIRFAHDPFAINYKKDDPERGLPIIMRGFVSNVVRNETISGGKPVRTITVAGQDFGKILSIYQIYYLNNSVVGDNIISSLAYFQKFADMAMAKNVSAATYVRSTLNEVINPYLAKIAILANGDLLGAKVANKLLIKDSELTIEGSVDPYLLSSFHDTSLHSMMSSVLDVGVFNEMYVEDRPDGPYLVVRPQPFVAAGKGERDFIQKNVSSDDVRFVDIPSDDVVAMNVSRSDSGVANYFWVWNPRIPFSQNHSQREMAMTAGSPYILMDAFNNAAKMYGFRKMEVETHLAGPSFSWSDSANKNGVAGDSVFMSDWLDGRRKVLVETNQDNILFESGTIRIRGDERIKPGSYLRINRGGAQSRYYAHRVDHDFVPFQGFFTTASVDRGTGFIDRAQQKSAPYMLEMNVKGIV